MEETGKSLATDAKDEENQLKLYILLVDQLSKYNTVIWQIPTALVIGNFLALEKFLTQPLPLIALALFNLGLIFVLYRMVQTQRKIITATQNAERKLGQKFGDFLPTFKGHCLPAPDVFIVILFILEAGLIGYIVCLFCCPPPPIPWH